MSHAITVGDVLAVFAVLLVCGLAFVGYAIWYVNSGRR